MFYLGDKEMKRDALWQNGSNKSQIRFSINKKILMLAAAIVAAIHHHRRLHP